MKPTLQLKLSQHLTLTPQLQQSIRLLQLSTLELNAEVERLLQENPLLEKADDDEGSSPPPEFAPSMVTVATNSDSSSDGVDETRPTDFDVLASAGSDSDWGSKSGSGDDDDEYFSPQQVATCSLRDHLNEQLAL